MMRTEDAITVEAAFAAIESALGPLGVEQVSLAQACGRVLQQEIVVDRDQPPFDRAAMDGFALRAQASAGATRATPVAFRVLGEATPGSPFEGAITAGDAVRIMTGAAVPPGCDAVVPVEETSGFGAVQVQVFGAVLAGQNVAARGSEARAGAVAWRAGQRLRAHDIGGLAMLGAATVAVGRRPRIAVLSTGDELVPHTQVPGPWHIRDSNAPLVHALAQAHTDRVRVVARARDDVRDLERAVADGLQDDLLIITGGVSMGAYDLVGAALEAVGVRFAFHRVALQPGKPAGFGVHAGGAVVALPGNPVSAFTTFRLFAATAVRCLEGEGDCRPRFDTLPAQFAWERRNPKWLLVPGRRTAIGVDRVEYAGSGDLLAYARADCQIVLRPGCDRVEPGTPISVWPFD